MPKPRVVLNAVIEKSGIQRYVQVPGPLASELGQGKYIPIVVKIGELETRATMVPGGHGAYRIFLNGEMRRAAGADTGEPVHLEIFRHQGPLDLPIPDAFRAALEADPAALAAFLDLTPGKRNEFIKFVEGVKKEEAKLKRISKSLEMLRRL